MSKKVITFEKEDFLRAIGAIKLRAETQANEVDKLENFVQIVNFSALSAPNTQIIYGRNGTGKTHIAKSFCQYCDCNFDTNKTIAIYIDCKDLDLGPVVPKISVDALIMRFYRLFITTIVNNIISFSREVITPNFLEKLFGGEAVERKQKIDESIRKIESIINLEEIEKSLTKYAENLESNREGSSKIGGQIGINSQLSLVKPQAELKSGVEVSAEEVEKEKEKVEIIYEGLAVIKYQLVREEIEKIIEQCGAKAVILLIDEWSSINLAIQPLFAEMIRKTLAVSNKVFLKIISLKYFTKLSAIIDPPQRIGFQPAIDISTVIDLDNLLNYDIDAQGVKDFLTTVAYKHAALELPIINNYTVKDFEEFLCNEVFDGEAAYFEVVRSSEGNPRDFLSVLSYCCSMAAFSVQKKISFKDAIQGASNHFNHAKAREIENNAEANTLFQKIYKKVVEKKSKLFLLSIDNAVKDVRIQELWHYRFIHVYQSYYTYFDENDIPNDYIVFSIDYGKLLTLKATEKGKKVLESMNIPSNISITTGSVVVTVKGVSAIMSKILEEPLKALGAVMVAEEDVNLESLINESIIFDDLLKASR